MADFYSAVDKHGDDTDETAGGASVLAVPDLSCIRHGRMMLPDAPGRFPLNGGAGFLRHYAHDISPDREGAI